LRDDDRREDQGEARGDRQDAMILKTAYDFSAARPDVIADIRREVVRH